MSWLVFDNKIDAELSLQNINGVYGCPIAHGEYLMIDWDIPSQSTTENKWAFQKPEAIMGKTLAELMAVIVGTPTELLKLPANWFPVE